MKCNNQRNLDISMAKVTVEFTSEDLFCVLFCFVFSIHICVVIGSKILPRCDESLFEMYSSFKGIWATTLANEKKLNKAFKVSSSFSFPKAC